MGKYAATHQTPAGTNLTIILLTGSAAIRCKLYELILGSDATPADVATEFIVARTTAVGTGGTALDEVPLDPLTVAATAAAVGGTFSGEPTYTSTANLMNIALNQRATFRWVAAPDGELISIASANNGLGLRSVASGGTPNINSTIAWQE